jgi:hypothetical protein
VVFTCVKSLWVIELDWPYCSGRKVASSSQHHFVFKVRGISIYWCTTLDFFFAPHLGENLVLRFRFDQNVFIPFQANTTSSTKYFIRPNVLV